MYKTFNDAQNLLLASARPWFRPEAANLHLEEANVEWPLVYSLAAQHRIVPLVYRFLKAVPSLDPPAAVLQRIDSHTRKEALSNLFQTRELNHVLDLLDNHGIEAMPFKGPALSQYLYDNLSMRSFGDLDLLIHRKDFDAVKALFAENDYFPFRTFSPKKERAFLDTQMGFEFVRKDERVVFEVHWSFLNRVHAFHLDPEKVWASKRPFELAGRQTFCFAPEHLLVYLCAHGCKSLWTRLRWVCDIAELMVRHTDMDFWRRVEQTARQSRSNRMVSIGLYLAHHLLEAPLPGRYRTSLENDGAITSLARQIIDQLFVPGQQNGKAANPAVFHLKMREHLVDRLPYVKHLAHLWSTPTEKDRAFLKLPAFLDFLYLFVKPIRRFAHRAGAIPQEQD